jgi:opacity protein-like surface antigen
LTFSARTLIFAVLPFSGPAFAQTAPAIGPFVIDARGVLTALPNDGVMASARGLQVEDLPASGLGAEVGAHVYPLRSRIVTLGLGASFLWSKGSDMAAATTELPAPPEVTTKLSAVSPQVSLNFGTGRGWSYISGGLGWAALSISRNDMPEEDGQTTRAFNYGAGARWFVSERIAFGFDLRYYSLDGQAPSGNSLGFPAKTKFAANVGVSFK